VTNQIGANQGRQAEEHDEDELGLPEAYEDDEDDEEEEPEDDED
jgi:hypothetical protein